MTYLTDVKSYKTSWRVQVKVLHAWKQYTSQSGETLEMVLADQKSAKINASIKKELVSKFERQVTKGEWRVIENFGLTQVRVQFRVTNHLFKMGFVNNTHVTPYVAISDDVYLTLPDFQNIIVGDLNPFYLIDVLGQNVNVGPMDTIEVNNKPTKKLEFEIRNISLPCTIWGKFADQVYQACEDVEGTRVVCLIRFTKIHTFRELVLSDEEKKKFALQDIDIRPKRDDSSLDKFKSMPQPPRRSISDSNVLIVDEKNYDHDDQAKKHAGWIEIMTP
ncbi:PREDICTED: uncharacterized protein LOC104710252 [Camelina sativa]|uniref:Uncharacterized protein LOC104710252 n=1 Tax=Camelina sativa TaxID=90675 RepID=A0ABM0TED9_CAMSA|nr:PREDICTED: uncharacterized protein LOC104710252 [Camelina sativa]